MSLGGTLIRSVITPQATEIALKMCIGTGCSSEETIGEVLCTILPMKHEMPKAVAVRFTSKRVMLAMTIRL